MASLAPLISDLALILITAGLAAILFKRLGQPLVLGYIVAGFLVGPHFDLIPAVTDGESMHHWADIGVIFLMFSLGLEFSFKKIVSMGSKPIIAACLVMTFMISVGSGVGRVFGWSAMDAMFLGGMLAMSSTTIIYKALDELGLREKKFAGEVLSVLILEDILGILLMVVLSAMAVSRQFEGVQLITSLLKLGFYLLIWLLVGLYIVPLFLRHTKRWLNHETLLLVSIGLCFVMVVLADQAGYSAAFGAFMMGSILAETLAAEKVEGLLSPLKDLFGAIFFVSVGMMVDPQILVAHWLPILLITIAVVVGQAVLGSSSFLLAGHSLKVAIQCGFSLGQIGEFAFIIASLGVALGVTSDFLYPIVVAVSIVTTFLTPYMMRAATPAYKYIERILPGGVVDRLQQRAEAGRADSEETSERAWHTFLRAIATQVVVFGVVSVAIVGVALATLLPLCRSLLPHWIANATCGIIALLALAPFLRAIVMRKNHTASARVLAKHLVNRILLYVLFALRYVLAAMFVYYVLDYLSPLSWMIHIAVALLIVGLVCASRVVMYWSIRIERTFRHNLGMRERAAARKHPTYARRLQAHDMHTSQIEIPPHSQWAGKALRELALGADGVMIAAVKRGTLQINIPQADTVVYPRDVLTVIADDDGLAAFSERLKSEVEPLSESTGESVVMRRIALSSHAALVGKTLRESGLRERYQCMAVGFEERDGSLEVPTADYVMQSHDVLYVVGETSDVTRMEKAMRTKPKLKVQG
ncbi:MAG: cation:proton antiporter [Bacteroidaceae bacterium]|nr:cation:proton antiporter [Bacteroidaceae bacterium]